MKSVPSLTINPAMDTGVDIDFEARSLSVTVNVAVYAPPLAYECDAETVPAPLASVTAAALLVPSPQSIEAVCVSSTQASLNVPAKLTVVPWTATVPGIPNAETTGVAFDTETA